MKKAGYTNDFSKFSLFQHSYVKSGLFTVCAKQKKKPIKIWLEVGLSYHGNIVLLSDRYPILDVFNPDEIVASPCFVFPCFSSRRQLD